MKIADLNEVSALHKETLPSLPAQIGKNYLKHLYRSLISSPLLHLNFVACQGKEIAGVICASSDFLQTTEILRRLLSRKIILQMIIKLISGRISLPKLIKRAIFEYKIKNKLRKPYLFIIILFVGKDFQGKGIGKHLINKLLANSEGKKTNIYADVRLENKPALKFYQKVGFSIKEQILDAAVLQLT